MKQLLDTDRELECHEETLKEMVQKLTRGDNMVCRLTCHPRLISYIRPAECRPALRKHSC